MHRQMMTLLPLNHWDLRLLLDDSPPVVAYLLVQTEGAMALDSGCLKTSSDDDLTLNCSWMIDQIGRLFSDAYLYQQKHQPYW